MTPASSTPQGRSFQSWNKKSSSLTSLEDNSCTPPRVPVNGLFSLQEREQDKDSSFNPSSSPAPFTTPRHKTSYARSDSGVGSTAHTPAAIDDPKFAAVEDSRQSPPINHVDVNPNNEERRRHSSPCPKCHHVSSSFASALYCFPFRLNC